MAWQKGEWMTNLFGSQLNLYFRKLRAWNQKQEMKEWYEGLAKNIYIYKQGSYGRWYFVLKLKIFMLRLHVRYQSTKHWANIMKQDFWRRCSVCHTKNTIQHMCLKSIGTYVLNAYHLVFLRVLKFFELWIKRYRCGVFLTVPYAKARRWIAT